MENDYRVNIVSLEMDRDAAEAEASVESTLSNSLESGITVESSRGDGDSKLDECAAAAWTNEKHNSYLDYLESSFVKQLYSLLGEETQRVSTTRDVQSKSHKSTDQFTVLQNGCWQKVNFGKKRVRLETSSEFQSQKSSPRSNPEIPTGNVLCSEEIKNFDDNKSFTRTSMRCSLGNEHPAQSSAEASGQNFSGEEEEKGRNSEVCRKRRRQANFDDSSLNDQVVP